jgi:hypothetical protein
VDLLESGDEREPVRLGTLLAARPPGWAVATLAVGLALVLGAGVLAAVAVDRRLERAAARPDVAVQLVDGSSSTVGGVARGTLELRLVNRGRDEVRVELGFEVEGLWVTGARPDPIGLLPPGAQREVRVAYRVPSCAALVLPGRLLVSARSDQQTVQRVLPVVDPRIGRPSQDALRLGACPPSSRGAVPGEPTDIGARPAGGDVRRAGAGAEGTARLEVRNGGPPVRLLSVDARVPGVVFTPRVLAGGLELPPDGLAIVTLRFRIADCRRLQQTGWLVLRVERFGGVQELGLRLTAEPAGGLGPQAPLPLVLGACD